MYCPQCKAEYRQGFARCSDCDVDLVQELHANTDGFAASGKAGGSAADSDDPICSFWQGDDPRIHAEICELLNEQGIPHKTIRREDHLFNLNSKSGFQIGIPFSQFEKAEAAIKDAYGTEQAQQDAARLLPYGKGYAPRVRGVLPWRAVLKGFGWEQDTSREEPENVAGSAAEEVDVDHPSEYQRSDRCGRASSRTSERSSTWRYEKIRFMPASRKQSVETQSSFCRQTKFGHAKS
jgi:hypothetical protein